MLLYPSYGKLRQLNSSSATHHVVFGMVFVEKCSLRSITLILDNTIAVQGSIGLLRSIKLFPLPLRGDVLQAELPRNVGIAQSCENISLTESLWRAGRGTIIGGL